MSHIERLAGLYLDLMERVLLGVIYEDPPIDQWSGGVFNPALRAKGRDWPAKAHTMIGFERLRNMRELMSHVIAEQVPGDFVETGVWRGGACIYMRAVLKVFGIMDRRIWVADSFAGLPKPDFAALPRAGSGRPAPHLQRAGGVAGDRAGELQEVRPARRSGAGS